jgi:hypothetical protein
MKIIMSNHPGQGDYHGMFHLRITWVSGGGGWQLSTHLSRCNGSRANMKMYSQYIFLSNIKLIFLGCPFRHYDADILRQKLVAYNVPYPAIKEVTILII